ncbi:MAG: hypothetical protein KGL02_06675, partial [Acidobacteriota bacterium]|nr:hypothetical protein [Acidobacteriota bacterium]
MPLTSFTDIPGGSSITLGGWDGMVNVATGNTYVPDGASAWEFSRRQDVKTKADEDYKKRTANPRGVASNETTFIFVTPRVWASKQAWIAERKCEGSWKDIRVYDAETLAQWLERAPAVGSWLARRIGKLPAAGIIAADEYWEDWSSGTNPDLTPALVVAGRSDSVNSIGQWLSGPAEQFFIKGETKEEAIAFACAAALTLQDTRGLNFFSRALVIQSTDAWRAVAQHSTPLILVADIADGSPTVAVRKGHHVLVPIGNGENGVGNGSILQRLGRDEIIKALEGMGISGDAAQTLARSTARSLPVIRRRLIGRSGGQKPAWAMGPNANMLLPALLVGQWSEAEADRKLVEAIAARPYGEIAAHYGSLLNQPDAPLRKIGEHWRLTSHQEAWELLAPMLTQQDLERFRTAALAVLGEISPEYEMPADDRYLAGMQGKVPQHSGALREGIADTLALMGSRPERASNAGDARLIADDVVRHALSQPGNWKMWASVGGLLPTLAEASPDVVLSRIDEGLSTATDAFVELLKDQGAGLFGGCNHAGLLWALERVAWSPEFFSRAASILARLTDIDPGGRWSNRPTESLRSLFLSWIRCSATPDDQRLAVLDQMLQRFPHPAWRCLIAAAPQSHDTLTSRNPPEWRGWSQDATTQPTQAEYVSFATQLIARIIQHVGEDPRRWKNLVGALANFPIDQRDDAIAKLEAAVPNLRNKDGVVDLWRKLREIVGLHRDVSGAGWEIPETVLVRLAAVYEALKPTDKFVASAWLFNGWPRLLEGEPVSTNADFNARGRKVEQMRVDALREIIAVHGERASLILAEQVEMPGTVGETIVSILDDQAQLVGLIVRYLADEKRAFSIFAQAACAAIWRRDGWPGLEAYLVMAKGTNDATRKCVDIYLAAPANMETWKRLEEESPELQAAYWSKYGQGIFLVTKDQGEFIYGVERLLNADRPLPVVYALAYYGPQVPIDYVVRALEATPKALNDAATRNHAVRVGDHELQRVFHRLDQSDVPRHVIAQLEIPFVGQLEYARPKLAVHREVVANAATFADLITWSYKRADGKVDDDNLDDAQRARRAEIGWRVLRHTHQLPGQKDDGTIDRDELRSWIDEARKLCAARSRGDIA